MSNVPTNPPADAERLRRFCQSLLAALDAAGTEHLPALPQELLRVLGSGVADVVEGLRQEAEACETAAASLRNLPSRYLAAASSVPTLLAELESAHAVAIQVAEALEALRSDSPELPPPVVKSLPPPASRQPPVSETIPEPTPAPDATRTPTLTDDSTATTLPTVGRETEQAATVFLEAEECRRRRDLILAEELYSQAVQIDPRFGPAYSRRGQVRTARGDLEGAIADFNAAIELDDTAIEAWWWRGDAHALAGRPTEAVADYDWVLALRPDLTRARYNLAVALRQIGENDRALTEFDQVIAERPTHAMAHLHRGMLYLQLDHRDLAAAEFRFALKLDPNCEPAREQLVTLNALAKADLPVLTVVLDVEEPEPTKAPAEMSAKPPVPSRPTASEGPPHPTPIPKPTPASSSKAEKQEPGQVAIKCPVCGAPGAVPWDRLGKVLVCSACKRRFGVKQGGSTVELVSTPEGKWVEAPQQREKAKRRRKQRLILVGAILVAILLPVGALAGWKAFARQEPVSAERELPRELSERAEVFAQAWLCNDVRTMKRLTAPAHDKVVYAWYNRHRPPAALRSRTDGRPPEGAKIEVTTRQSRPGQSLVQIRLTNPKLAPDHPGVEMTWTWEESAETWYFVPPSR